MPIYVKDGQEFELPEDFDTETGVDRNREKALAKGYKVYVDVQKGDSPETFAIPETDIDKATAKGYRLAGTAAAPAPNKAAQVEKFGEVTRPEAVVRGLAQSV